MRIRALTAAICVAGFAAGSAVTQARASVQPSAQRSGSAVVGTDVDAVSALTSLPGTFNWWFLLSNSETTALTNATIHVAPPTGPAPPDIATATIAAGSNLSGFLPSEAGVVTPEFDSARSVAGVAAPGTHPQTVTVTLTPRTFPLGYSESWASVSIEGLSTATNSAVLSAPAGAAVDDVGTSRVQFTLYNLLPQTPYTMQVTFDVTNPNSSPVPYKPSVRISESFGANLTATPAQQSYTFTDPDLGTATWSIDQNVVWLPRMFRNTTVSYTPIPVLTVAAWANDWRRAYIELSSDTDTVGSASVYTGWRTWDGEIVNASTLPTPAPQISVDQSSQSFTPAVTFPVASGVGTDLDTQYEAFSLGSLSGRAFGGSQVDGADLSTGFDVTRTASPATLPADGGTQDVTVTFVARDPRYAHTQVTFNVLANPGPPASAESASIVAGSVTADSAGQSETAPIVYTHPASVSWYPYDVVVGRTYTLTLKITVPGTGSPFPYKPQVTVSAASYPYSGTAVGQTATIADPVLGGTFTFAAGSVVNWSLSLGDFVMATLDGITPPQRPYVYTYINNYDSVSEPADVDSVGADSTLTGLRTWYASMCSTTADTLPKPSISVDGSFQTFTPPVSFPAGTRSQSSLAGNGCLSLPNLAGESWGGSGVDDVAITTGYDVSRTMSPATIAPGGDTQTVQVSITPRDPRDEQVTLDVEIGSDQRAQIDTSSVGWPTVGGGEQAGTKTAEPAYVYTTVNNPVVGKTYTLTVRIHVPNSTSVARAFKPALNAGAGFHVDVDAGTPPADGPSTAVHDDLLGGTFTFSFDAPIHWTHNLWREQDVNFAGLWSGIPVGDAYVYRITRVAPDASADSVDGLQPTPATMNWIGDLWNDGSDVLPAPKVSLDESSKTFVPQVTFPLSVTGADLQSPGGLGLEDLDGGEGHSHVDLVGLKTGFDVSRTASPSTIPAGGGEQTLTVSVTVRDPQLVGAELAIDVISSNLVHDAVIDAGSVIPPTSDPAAAASTYVNPDGRSAFWHLPAAALDTTYTLTLQVHVPNGAATVLRYKPTVTVQITPPATQLPAEVGPATTIPDSVLGGTFTFVSGADVDWVVRSLVAFTEVDLAPLAAPIPADTTPPVLSVPADKVVDATGSAGATVTYQVTATDDVDPNPAVACTPLSGSTFPIGTTTVNCTATDTAGNQASGSFAVKVDAAPSAGGGGGGGGGGGTGAADLRLEGSVEPALAGVGETITWRITVNDYNTGPATGVWVDVQLPSSVSLVSSYSDRGTGCTVAGDNKLHCYLDWLADNVQFGHVILVTRVTAVGDHVLTAVTGYSAADPTPADNSLTLTATTPAPSPPPRPPAPVVRPVIGQATITPAAAAGRHVVVSFRVTRSDNAKPLVKGTMICDPSIQGKVIHHAEQFTHGVARLSFTIPKNAKGKLLKVRLTIKLAGQSAGTVATFPVK